MVGRVFDAATQEPLPGARVEVAGTPLAAATARDGSYRLPGLAAGSHTISVSYLGYGDAKAEVVVAAGEVNRDFELSIAFKEQVEVSESALDAQARALNQQRTAANITNVVSADQIGRFPDPNAAEATQRSDGSPVARSGHRPGVEPLSVARAGATG